MPELPEVESVRRALESLVVGTTVTGVTLRRRDIVTRPGDPQGGWSRRPRANTQARGSIRHASSVPKAELLCGQPITQAVRKGKALVLLSPHRALLVHLGMTGQLIYEKPGERFANRTHIHIVWHLERKHTPGETGREAGRLIFRDPRRFGGVWTIASHDDIYERHFARLGPDAINIRPADLQVALARTKRPIKAALLDQRLIAGVGNIYADESLHAAQIGPERCACTLSETESQKLAAAVRTVLRRAVRAGGTTLRDYLRPDGTTGGYSAHAVYGRAGLPCPRCCRTLESRVVAQRTTVACPECQGWM